MPFFFDASFLLLIHCAYTFVVLITYCLSILKEHVRILSLISNVKISNSSMIFFSLNCMSQRELVFGVQAH